MHFMDMRFLDTANKVIKEKVPLHYVVLRPSEAVCAKRAATRTEGTISDYKYYHELYKSFDEVQRYIIPDGTSNASVIAAHVREGLDEGMFRMEFN